MNDEDVLHLQQLLSLRKYNKHVQQQQKSSSKTTAPVKPTFSPTVRPYIENDVDPMWYLVEGPLIIFPREKLLQLKIEDLVDMYRAYPTLNWSKYPALHSQIMLKLTERERGDLREMKKTYDQTRKLKKKLYNTYHTTVVKDFSLIALLKWLLSLIRSLMNLP